MLEVYAPAAPRKHCNDFVHPHIRSRRTGVQMRCQGISLVRSQLGIYHLEAARFAMPEHASKIPAVQCQSFDVVLHSSQPQLVMAGLQTTPAEAAWVPSVRRRHSHGRQAHSANMGRAGLQQPRRNKERANCQAQPDGSIAAGPTHAAAPLFWTFVRHRVAFPLSVTPCRSPYCRGRTACATTAGTATSCAPAFVQNMWQNVAVSELS